MGPDLSATPKRSVYITGVTGRVGRILAGALKDEYVLAGSSRRGTPVPGVSVASGDTRDQAFLQAQLQGCDTVIHLAADPSPKATWKSVLENNIDGTHALYVAARLAGVSRVIFASTNHVSGILTEKAVTMGAEAPVRPDSYYGVSKAFGEAMGRYYSDRYGLSVLNFRIGWIPGEKTEQELIDLFKDRKDAYPLMWLSPDDCIQAHVKGINAPDSLKYGTYYIMSNNRDLIWDMTNAEEDFGYRPKDDLGAIFDRFDVPYDFRIPRNGLGG